MKQAGASKFTYPAEMLPNNERTKVIMKAREEEQAAKEATEKAVSTTLILLKQTLPLYKYFRFQFSSCFLTFFLLLIVERQATKGGKRAQEEGECRQEG